MATDPVGISVANDTKAALAMPVTTQRLLLRPPRLADVPALFRFLGDRAAMQHTHCDATLRDCLRRIAVHEWRRRRDGCAPWTIIAREDERIVGWGGLYNDPFDPGWGVELGYFLDPSAWGRGYASELAAASTAFADTVLGLPEICAFARPENLASRRVLEKAGFETVRFIPEMERLLFRRVAQCRPVWAGRNTSTPKGRSGTTLE